MTETWIDRLPWDQLAPGKVDSDHLLTVKAAALVEFNAHDYADYLYKVFPDDAVFQEAIAQWAEEEVLHGRALGLWAKAIDPDFDFDGAVTQFRTGYSLPQEVEGSVRGSRAGELMSRCIVEVGTSSFYTAFARATEEPVLKKICARIAADEFRHYKLFYVNLKRYLDEDQIGRLKRVMIAAGRIQETEDDELAYANYAANGDRSLPYNREIDGRSYLLRVYRLYGQEHIDRAISMSFKAAGLKPHSSFAKISSRVAFRLLKLRQRRMERAALKDAANRDSGALRAA
ncbi:MAG: ferritin-like domain-containing protein [Kiloniellales bacterium]